MSSVAHNFEDKVRTKDVLIEEQLNFNGLLLSDRTLAGLHNAGFRIPSPIQLKAIPMGKCGFDLIVKSKSGTGKTAVFSIIALELINVKNNSVQVLILSPTREVAIQIQDVIKSIGAECQGLVVESFIGGLPVEEDIKKITKCHIAVGAPGRIKHLLQLGVLKPKAVKLFVLDEADRLIGSDMGADVDYILKTLPVTKQVIASSATYSEEVLTSLNNLMSSPTLVEPNIDTPLLLGLKQFVAVVKSNLNVVHQMNIKNAELMKLLSQITFSQCLVFTNYQSRAESISNILNRSSWNSMYISGAQNQSERLKVINSLKEGKCRILLSTDVTARGIDAANIDLVINYDIPYEASTYLHRMGRAGRFGTHGVCVTIAAQGKDLKEYQKILGTIGGVNLFVPQLPKADNIPSDLWNADSSGLELIQGVIENSESINKVEILNSIADLKTQINNFKQVNLKSNDNESEKCQINDTETIICEALTCGDETETLNESRDVHMSNVIETLINNNKKQEENLKSQVAGIDAITLLKGLANCKETSKFIATDGEICSDQELLGDVLIDLSQTKKRKRAEENVCSKNESDNKISELEKVQSTNNIVCKNVALLSATKLLCESYDLNPIPKEITTSLESYLKSITADKFKKIFLNHAKEEILTAVINKEVGNILEDLNSVGDNSRILENASKSCNSDLEDIFKLSYDYAVSSATIHWLDILGEELEEKMSLTENNSDFHSSLNEIHNLSLDLPKRRKHKTHKKKSFKDFTQRNKKNKVEAQSMETYAEEIKDGENQVDCSYQTGLYSDHEYSNNEHFGSCFDYYSNELTQKLQTFDDVPSFDAWFADWQWQVQGVRDYVQQNVYLQEMNRYTYYNN